MIVIRRGGDVVTGVGGAVTLSTIKRQQVNPSQLQPTTIASRWMSPARGWSASQAVPKYSNSAPEATSAVPNTPTGVAQPPTVRRQLHTGRGCRSGAGR